jgi:hypothetical protein
VDTALISQLIRLRYKLLWAKTRSRNGRIALFLAGYLILVGVVSLLVTGGFGAAVLAVKSGKALVVAQAVLGGIFLEAAFASNILGFGLNAIFSDLELRRYPLRATDRRIARHLIGIADPFWLLFLALYIGMAVGMYVAGGSGFWSGLIAVLLLFACNYVFARVIALVIDRMMQKRGGSALLLALVLVLALAPSLMVQAFKTHPQWGVEALRCLAWTPPFGAAAAMVPSGMQAVNGILLIVMWTLGLLALLVRLENLAPVNQSGESVKVEWESRYERAAAIFGPDAAPLVAHWLRFYLRNNRTRAMSVLALPLIAFLTYQNGQKLGPNGFFIAALGTFPAATFLGVARITVNQFGYSGGGFRRYFLLPTDPGATLRAGSYASLLIGGGCVPVLLAAWLVFAPKPIHPATVVMLTCSTIAGLFLFHAAALWVSLINPRKGNYNSSLGNDLSLGGNILVIGGMLTAIFGPMWLSRMWPAPFQPGNWWMALLPAAVGVVLYVVSLNAASAALGSRRERLLAVVEGRD